MYHAIGCFKNAKNIRKIMVVLSDGEDNCSRHSDSDIRKAAQQSDVQIYALENPDVLGIGRYFLSEIAYLTGGRVLPLRPFSDVEDAVNSLRTELHSSYLLSYTMTDKKKDGKWRNSRIKLKPPKGSPKLTVHFRQGYYSPNN